MMTMMRTDTASFRVALPTASALSGGAEASIVRPRVHAGLTSGSENVASVDASLLRLPGEGATQLVQVKVVMEAEQVQEVFERHLAALGMDAAAGPLLG